MIRVMQQGAAWAVVRDGRLMREGAGAAVHKTRELAEQHAARLAAKLEDDVAPPGTAGTRETNAYELMAGVKRKLDAS